MAPQGSIQQTPQRYAFILNPHSGNGQGKRQFDAMLPRIRELLGDTFSVFETSESGDASQLTRQSLRDGFDRVVSAGGDGTHFEVVNGFFDGTAQVAPEASMAILPIGTGSDYRRTLCVPKGEAALEFITADTVTPIDVGRVTSTYENGEQRTAHYNTAVHIGLGGLVGEHTNRRSKALGGFMTFLLGVISARLEWKNVEMTVRIDDEIITETLMEVIVANGFYDGGGMHVAPKGLLDDGLFEVYTVGELGIVGSLLNIPRMYRGTHDKHPAVLYRRAKRVEVTSPARVIVSPDGEVTGVLPAVMEIVPKAVRIVAGPGLRVQQD